MLRPILALVACSTLALAQALPDPPPPRPPQAQGWLVDAITATVNDSAIMLSDLRTLTASAIRGAERQFGPLSPQEHKLITQRELAALVNKYRMAQSVKSLGVLTPEQVEQLLRSELDSDKEDQRRDLGSMQALSLELKRQGRSWPTYEREKRVDKLNLFAQEFAVNRRLARQTNLFLTPRMLRQTYDDNRGMFVRDAAAKVVWVQFQGADAAATAEQAAALWRREELSPRQLADRFKNGVALSELNAKDLAPDYEAVRTFALAGPAGSVSAPIQVRGNVVVARVTEYRSARNGRFEDPEVQGELRKLCENRVIQEFQDQALGRAQDRTEVWTSPSMK